MAYDITEAFEDIELALIKSMRANMKRHINDEYDEGMNWTQWQAEMLSGLSQYRAENQEVLKGYMGKINSELARAIRDAYATGESELEIELLKQIQNGYTPPKNGKKVNMQGAFFSNNQRKLNALVRATTDDMKKAETALLRMTDDIYRQTIFKAQMFYNTGAGSMWKCVDMATKDFLAAGYNCVEYKNGARVNIASYSEMALRTANKRANLMGQANFREKHGMHLVKINARGTACPLCLPYLGQVYVDDVYGGGTAEESVQTGYPLLSTAVSGGLFHPNCKDACSTYYDGINQPPAEVTDEQAKEINRRYNLEQTQRYYERNYRKNVRLANGSLTEENVKKYSARASAYKKKLTDLCNANSDVLRLDKQRLSLHGVLSVDKNGRLSITPKSNKNATTGKIDSIQDINNRGTRSLLKAYDDRRKHFNLNLVPAADLEKSTFNNVAANYTGIDVKMADAFDKTISDLSKKYYTGLTSIQVADKKDMFGAPFLANTEHNNSIGQKKLVINPLKMGDYDKAVSRIKELSAKGYAVRIKAGLEDSYIATHEFAHSLADMSGRYKNFVGLDERMQRTIKKDIEGLYESYVAEVNLLEATQKKLELDFINATLTADADTLSKLQQEAVEAKKKLDAVKISRYSMENADEFMAEAFTQDMIGEWKSTYTQKVMDIINKYFRK